jgi:hypothetical protein
MKFKVGELVTHYLYNKNGIKVTKVFVILGGYKSNPLKFLQDYYYCMDIKNGSKWNFWECDLKPICKKEAIILVL